MRVLGSTVFLASVLVLGSPAQGQDFVRAAELAKQVETGTNDLRKSALEQLEKMGPNAISEVRTIASALADSSEEIQIRAIAALKSLGVGAKKASPELRRLATSGSPKVRQHAVAVLEKLSPEEFTKESPQGLTRAERRKIERAKQQTLHELGVSITPRDGAAAIMQGLRSTDIAVQREATTALANLSNTTLKTLEELLKSKDAGVREGATRALGAHGAAALPVFIRGLQSDNADVRARSAQGIRLVSPPLGDSTLLALRHLLQDTNPTVRLQAALTLGGAAPNDLTPVPVLIEALSLRDQAVRAGAVLALTRFGEQGVPFVMEALQKKSPESRLAALSAVAFLPVSGELMQSEVAPLLQDPDERVRKKTRFILDERARRNPPATAPAVQPPTAPVATAPQPTSEPARARLSFAEPQSSQQSPVAESSR